MARNRLSKMRITRVSLVDRPAGIGAEVVLAKRDDTDGDNIGDAVEAVEKSNFGDGISQPHDKNNNNTGDRANMSQAHAPHGRTSMGTDGVIKGYGKAKHADHDMDMDDEDMDMEMDDEMPRPKRKKMAKSEADLDTILKSLPEEAVSYIERLEDIILDMQESVAKGEDDEDEDDDEAEAEAEVDADEADEDEAEVEEDEDDEPVAESDESDEGDEPVTKFVDADDLETVLKTVDPRLASIMKSYVSKAEKKAAAAEKIAKRERDLRLHREYVAKAADLSALPAKQEDIVTLISTVADKAPEVEELLSSVLKAAHGALKESVLFKSEGSDALDDNTAIAKFDAVVKEIRKSDPALSAEQAFTKALESHPELYDEYLNTNSKGR